MIFTKKKRINSSIVKLFTSILFLFFSLSFTSCLFSGLAKSLSTPYLSSPWTIKADNITSDQATIYWTPVKADKEYTSIYYEVIYYYEGSEYKYNTTTSETYIHLENLEWDESYKVLVRSCALSSQYKPSDYISTKFKTLDSPVPEGQLKRPANVKVEYTTEKTGIKVSWTPVENAVYYDIKCSYRSYPSDSDSEPHIISERIITVPASQHYAVDNILNKGDVTYYSVTARNTDFSNTCWWSKAVRIKTP